jgi:hypothetical protein
MAHRVPVPSVKYFRGISSLSSLRSGIPRLLDSPAAPSVNTLRTIFNLKNTAMKTFVKHYIGKGKQVEGLSIAKCTVKLEDLEKFSYKYDGVTYVTFEVAKMKEKDSFGRDYTVYVSKKEEAESDTPEKEKKTKKAKKHSQPEPELEKEDLPF